MKPPSKDPQSASQLLSPRRTVKLLLINPRFPESFWSFQWVLKKVLSGKRALNPPLGLATLAALCPPDWEVEIIDENIETVPLEPRADIIGICGMGVQFRRQRELLDYYRRGGYYVVAGGSFASLCPERYRELADTVVAGEAEYIWPEFCRQFAQGTQRPLYQEKGLVDLAHSPIPRFDLLKLDQYTSASLQFSRGCPYRCEFCDIIVMFGRRPRTKPLSQIGKELDLLRRRGVRNAFFVDDNLIGHKAKAKALLKYLADNQRHADYAFQFGTEASLNLAEDDELLNLFREANFSWVFIGIESPDEASLKEAGKTQNMRQDILSAIHKIYRNGIDVLAGFIVGFDNDTLDIFDRQQHFITASGIQVAMVALLTALPRTPLHKRLEQEGRLLPQVEHIDNTRPGTNFVPKRMSYDAMVDGFKGLYRRLVSNRCIAQRIRNKTRQLQLPIYKGDYPLAQSLRLLVRFLFRGLLPGGPGRWFHFLHTIGSSSPRAWPIVIHDWIVGLAVRDYVRRHFGTSESRERRIGQTTLTFIRRNWAACLRRGALAVSLGPIGSGTCLTVTLRGIVDTSFFTRGARRLEKLLRRSTATLTLHIDALSANQQYHLERLLRRLARYGDQVSIRINEKLRHLLPIDSSVFHLVLDEA